MSQFRSLGISPVPRRVCPNVSTEWVTIQQPLRRVLRFTGRSIDDIVNSPIVKNEIIGYFKLQRMIERRGEIVELEKQWNAVG